MCNCGQTWPASARGAETQSKIDLKRHLGARVANGASRDKIFSGRAVLNTRPFYAGCRGGGTRCTGVWIIQTVPPMYIPMLAALKQADCNFSPPRALPPFIFVLVALGPAGSIYTSQLWWKGTRGSHRSLLACNSSALVLFLIAAVKYWRAARKVRARAIFTAEEQVAVVGSLAQLTAAK